MAAPDRERHQLGEAQALSQRHGKHSDLRTQNAKPDRESCQLGAAQSLSVAGQAFLLRSLMAAPDRERHELGEAQALSAAWQAVQSSKPDGIT